MRTPWQLLTLGDSLDLFIDNRGKNPPYTDTGVPCVSGMAVTDRGLDFSKTRSVDEQTWLEWMPRPMRSNDVILTSEAPLGRPAILRSDEPIVLAQRVFGLRGKVGVLDSRFLFYSLFTEQVRADMLGRATGTTVFGIRQPALKAVSIPAPNYAQQCAIADVLSALDDKISANNKLTATVDQFLAALFTRVTDGAPIIQLGAVATVNPETCRPISGGILRYIDISSVGQGSLDFPDISSWDEAPSRARRHVQSGDTLWSTVRPNRRSHTLNLSEDPLLVGSTGLAVLRPQGIGFAYLYEATKTPAFTAYLENVAEGSAYPAVRANRFNDAPISWVTDSERESFEMTAAPLRKAAESLSSENLRLVSVRDTLLPQLMSGKLRVKDAEEIVSNAI